jgi:hypothetical protein
LGTDFPVPFSYLAKSHVNADFNKILQSQASFTVYAAGEAVTPASPFGASQAFIRFTSNFPAAGTSVRVRRITEKAIPLVDFQDGSALIAEDQDLAFLQNFYLNQENVEQADNALGKIGSVFFAGGTRITEIGQPTSANDATTKLYVDNQDALKVSKAGDSMTGALAMGTNKITGLGTPTVTTDATNKTYVDTQDALKVSKAGDSMTGALAMGTNKITGLAAPTDVADATTKAYVDAGLALKVAKAGDAMTGALAMGNNKITGLGIPTADTDAATKAYADTKLSIQGGSLFGDLNFGGFTPTGLGLPDTLTDATSKQYVDSSIQQYITTGGVSGNPIRWLFTGDGTTLVFVITGATALYTNSYLVTIDGVVQDPTYSYNVSISTSPTLTFDQAPPSGTRIVVISLGYAQPTISAIPNNTVGTNAIVSSAVTSDKIANGSVLDSKMGANAIATANIKDLNVTTAKLADLSVTSTKVVDANITNAKLATSAVTSDKINDSAVGTSKISDGAVTTAKITDASITNAKIADGTIATAKLADSSVTDAKLAGSISASKLATQAGVTTGTYGSTTQAPQVTVNAQGLVTAVSNQSIAFPAQRVVNVYSVIKRDTFTNSAGWRFQSVTGLQIGTANTAPYTGGYLNLSLATNRVLIQGTIHVGDSNNYQTAIQLMRWQTGTAPIAATAMVAANYYMVVVPGTTTFTSFGAQANSAGTYFRATGAGTGTGTVLPVTMLGIGNQDGVRTRVTAAYISNVNGYSMFPVPLDLMDAPGYTNVSYDLLIGTHGTGVSYVNRNHLWQNPSGGGSGSNSLTYDPLPSSTLVFTELTA